MPFSCANIVLTLEAPGWHVCMPEMMTTRLPKGGTCAGMQEKQACQNSARQHQGLDFRVFQSTLKSLKETLSMHLAMAIFPVHVAPDSNVPTDCWPDSHRSGDLHADLLFQRERVCCVFLIRILGYISSSLHLEYISMIAAERYTLDGIPEECQAKGQQFPGHVKLSSPRAGYASWIFE